MDIQIRSLDVVAIALYLLAIAGIGVYFSRKNKSTEEYFVGNRSFRGWVIGLSMLGTSISSVTFLAFPALAFASEGDWKKIVPNLFLPLVAVFAIAVFIPFFRRRKLTSAFEYLGNRYNTPVRLYGTVSFIFLQLIRLAMVLSLVAVPVQFLTGAPMWVVIVATGVFIALYTVAGGIEAVIWTDVMQAIVLLLGGIVCFVYIVVALPEGFSQILEIGSAHQKFNVGELKWDVHEETFWTVAVIGIFQWLAMYSSDQNMIQRYAAARSTSEARKAAAIYSAVAVPTWVFFCFLGTCVWVYYSQFPDSAVTPFLQTKNPTPERVFPYFVLTEVPAGVAGIVIAGVLAAAMSSLDSSINAISTVITVDILKPFVMPGRDDRVYLRWARGIAIVTAAWMIAGALLLTIIPKESFQDFNLLTASVFGGCLVGLFLLGFFTKRVDGFSALVALVAAIVVNVYLGLDTWDAIPDALSLGVHKYWVGILVNVVFVVLAYGLSLIRRRPAANLEGLTVWTPSTEGRED